ncbi:MAG: low-specificity L-threonine aldolase [Planctomycetes bacterium]|nr:low-specificity L-threonine aldolase [Planctomycetota bacterium]
MIDLRSDTVTEPCDRMREAMATAQVGDDVLGADPTVKQLEEFTAEILGKEAALYMPSGTMTNQVAIRLHTQPGDEIVMEENSHTYYYESGGPAALSGVMCQLIKGDRGLFTAEQLTAALRPKNLHFAPTKLLVLENTHNRGGGKIWPIDQLQSVTNTARNANLRTHLDGARLWNASAATGIPEKEYAKHFDTISVCFSKGLGAPVGSALAGSAEMIDRARRFRKMFGGGMRQAGIIAAGAIFALQNNRPKLKADHKNAKLLAEGLTGLKGIDIDPAAVETNIVFFNTTDPAAELVEKMNQKEILMLALGENSIRAVTNLMVTKEMTNQAIETIRSICQ